VPPHDAPQNLVEKLHAQTLAPPRRGHDGDVVYAVVGVLVLVTMLLIATGAMPVYEWEG
jgi:hypothetical protein